MQSSLAVGRACPERSRRVGESRAMARCRRDRYHARHHTHPNSFNRSSRHAVGTRLLGQFLSSKPPVMQPQSVPLRVANWVLLGVGLFVLTFSRNPILHALGGGLGFPGMLSIERGYKIAKAAAWSSTLRRSIAACKTLQRIHPKLRSHESYSRIPVPSLSADCSQN